MCVYHSQPMIPNKVKHLIFNIRSKMLCNGSLCFGPSNHSLPLVIRYVGAGIWPSGQVVLDVSWDTRIPYWGAWVWVLAVIDSPFPANVYPGVQQVTAAVVGSLPPIDETCNEFLTPGLSLAHFQWFQAFKEWTSKWEFCLSICICLSLCLSNLKKKWNYE